MNNTRWRGTIRNGALRGALIAAAIFASEACAQASAAPEKQELSDALKAARPARGEHFGLYLMDKKIGYVFTDLSLVPGSPNRARSVSEFVFKANVSNKVSERLHKEVRTYEAKPGGRLLGFRIEDSGDGGTQVMDGTATAAGMRVVRKRPGQAEQILNLPPSQETVEDADQVRVAIRRNKTVEGFVTDGQDLGSYKMKTTLEPPQQRPIRGVNVTLHKAITLSEKENVPAEVYVADNGDMVELNFGQSMKAVAESESVAKRLDRVEVFGLTRITLPRSLSEDARKVPGLVKMVMAGLPEKFRRATYRQKFKNLPDSQAEVTISAAPPNHEKPIAFPIRDPNGGEYLKSSIIVESDSPEIQKQAKKIVAGEKDAYAAAKKIVSWVGSHMKKEYGASADRATDVLRQMKGDCTEHSLLSVSLLRASGIPAKRVDGVVYMMTEDGVPALYWHEWVEAYVGEWTQLDPTFGQPVADATHFAVGEEANAEITPLIGQLKVIEVR